MVKKETEYLPLHFESDDSSSIEKKIISLNKEYGLKRDNYDFTLFDECDLFLENVFDSS